MDRADQRRFVTMVADRHELDIDAFCLQQHRCSPDNLFADPALTKSTAYDDPFGILPILKLQKAADNTG